MINIFFSEIAKKEFLKLDNALQIQFKKAIMKIQEEPFRKHLKFGVPAYVIKVTKQSRIVYSIDSEEVIILHCFSSHNDYENWYNSYK